MEQEIEINTNRGYYLSGTLRLQPSNDIQAQNGENPEKRGVFLVCHGMLKNRESEIIKSITLGLPYSTFALDFRGNGKSGGETHYGNYHEEVEDLREAVVHLRDKYGLFIYGMVGYAKGGSVVLLYAAQYNDISYVINIGARYDLSRAPLHLFTDQQLRDLKDNGWFIWKKFGTNCEKDYIIREEDLIRRTETDMSVASRIDKALVRVLTIHGLHDQVVPLEDALAYDHLLG
ncbi:alpha/beta-hydrolase, partial [Basidiobolus meristosporus CBS 931.73]